MFLHQRRQVLTNPPQGGVPELAQEWAGKVRKVVFNGVLPKGVVAGSTISKQVTRFGTSLVQPSRIWNYSVDSEYAIDLGTRPNSATFLIIAERNCDCDAEQNIAFIMNCATLGDGGVGISLGNWWNSPIHRNKLHAGSEDLWIGGVFQSLVPSLSDNALLADTPYTFVNSISTMTGGEYKLFAKDDSYGYVSPVKIHLFVELDLQSPESAKSLSANPWQIFKRPDSRIFVPVSVGGGPTNITGILLSTLDSITTAIQGSLGHSGTLSISLDTIAVTGNGVLNHIGTSSSTLDGVVITFSGAVDTAGSVSGTLACTLDSIVFSGAGNLNHSTTISITLDDVFVSLAGTVAGTPENIDGTLSIVLDGIGFTSSGNSGTLTLTEDDINAIMTAIINNPKTLTIPKFLGLK